MDGWSEVKGGRGVDGFVLGMFFSLSTSLIVSVCGYDPSAPAMMGW